MSWNCGNFLRSACKLPVDGGLIPQGPTGPHGVSRRLVWPVFKRMGVLMKARPELLAVVLAVMIAGPAGAADIPPSPAKDGVGAFTHDFAGLLDADAQGRIAAAQRRAFEGHDTPIVVVTVRSMLEYKHNASIESLAREWFDAWRIGTSDRAGGANKGVLVLVSLGDRKARIELGADWGRKWDDYCQRIMNGKIIPAFKRGDHAGGITAGVESLAEMAALGPAAVPPAEGLVSRVQGFVSSNGFPPTLSVALLVAGVVLLPLGFLAPRLGLSEAAKSRILMASGGSFLIGMTGVISCVLVVAFAMMRMSGRGGSHSGGYSGGSSGGGGASGSW